MFQPPPAEKNAGFTLIEALVALAIVAVALTSIGSLVATSARGAVSIEVRLTRLETARAIMSALPDRDELIPWEDCLGNSPNTVGVSMSCPSYPTTSARNRISKWVPRTVIVTVQAPDGATMRLNTIRLQQVNIR